MFSTQSLHTDSTECTNQGGEGSISGSEGNHAPPSKWGELDPLQLLGKEENNAAENP